MRSIRTAVCAQSTSRRAALTSLYALLQLFMLMRFVLCVRRYLPYHPLELILACQAGV